MVLGDVTEDGVLGAAKVHRAATLLALTSSDTTNLEATLSDLRAKTPAPVFWLIGKTQSGKTSIIKFLTGADDAVIGSGFRPTTRTTRRFEFPSPDAPLLTFLDTRGLDEPGYDPTADIEALDVFPALRRAYDEELIDPQTIGRSELDEVEASPRGDLLERMKDRYPPIDDVARATSWWARFERRASSRRAEELALAAAGEFDDRPMEPYRAPQKVGRNEPCPCGSGKKYKKCCGGVNV